MGGVPPVRVMAPLPPPPVAVAYGPGSPLPPGTMLYAGVLVERPKPAVIMCYKRSTKLLIFLLIAIVAGIGVACLFAFPADLNKRVAIICTMVAVLLIIGIEYAMLAQRCTVDPLTGEIRCDNAIHNL